MKEDAALGCLLIIVALVLLYFGFLEIDRGAGEIVDLEGRVTALNFMPKHWQRSGAMVHSSRLVPDSWYATVKVENREAGLHISKKLFDNLRIGAPVRVECSRGRWTKRVYLLRVVSKA